MALTLGRWLLGAGLLCLFAGGLLLLASRLGLPLGRLPGDLHFRGRHTEVFAPLGTSLLLSVVLSLLLALTGYFRR